MNALFKCFLLVICLGLSACAANMYVQPRHGANTATIRGGRVGFIPYNTAKVETIDDRPIGLTWSESSKVRLAPGKHDIGVLAYFARSLFGNAYTTNLIVPLNVRPGQNYVVKAIHKRNHITSWVENSQGRVVSARVSEKYQVAPQSSTVIVPIAVH